MKKLIGLIIAAVFALGVSAFAQTTEDTSKKRTENYGQQRSSDVNNGQQGELIREQKREETQNAGDVKKEAKEQKKEQKKEKKEIKKEAKEQKKEMKEEQKQQRQQESGNKGNAN